VFVELRNLRTTDFNIVDYIISQFGLFELVSSALFFEKAMQAGRFVFFFDGFDELPVEVRVSVSDQILEMSDKYTENTFVISSRADDICQSWSTFDVFKAAPLSLNKACLVAERLKYDLDVTVRFVNDLKNGMYSKHKSFLSNPLLLTIMLLTYRDNAEIPDRLHNFYSQAFDALYSTHDALKEGGLRRTKRTKMAVDEFRNFLSVFCILTYADRKFRFSNTEFSEYVNKARQIAGKNVSTQEFLDDLTQSLCLFVVDGLEYTFTHRSFQEYFAAVYIGNLQDRTVRSALMWKVASSVREDRVISILYGLNQFGVEQDLLIPWIDELGRLSEYNDNDLSGSYARFIPLFIGGFYNLEAELLPFPPNDDLGVVERRIGLLTFVYATYLNIGDDVFDKMYIPRKDGKSMFLKLEELNEVKDGNPVITISSLLRSKECLVELNQSFLINTHFMQALFRLKTRLCSSHKTMADSVAAMLLPDHNEAQRSLEVLD